MHVLSSPRSCRFSVFVSAACTLAAAVVFVPIVRAETSDLDSLLRETLAEPAIAVVWAERIPGDQLNAVVSLAREARGKLLIQLADFRQYVELSRLADEAGVDRTRLFLEYSLEERIAAADGVANLTIVLREPTPEIEQDALRTVRPGGALWIGGDLRRKPVPDGIDEWTHHYHSPDNFTQSSDRLAKAPFWTQFVGYPRYAPAPQSAVAAGGRVFMALGHVAWHQREEPWLNTLVAVDGYNGMLLWKRPLTPGLMVDRSMMVATPSALYLAEGRRCKVLDAATGDTIDEITIPREIAPQAFWKWIALVDGTLYALVGEDEPLDAVARWKRTQHGWPWNGISRGYNAAEYKWGFGDTLVAIDTKNKTVRWHAHESPSIDSRTLCIAGGRIFYGSFGNYLVARSIADGGELWRRTPQSAPHVFDAIGPYRPGHGYISGWKSTAYMKASERAVYVLGPQVEGLTAISAATGELLWQRPAKDFQIVLRQDGLYAIGPQNLTEGVSLKLDPATGEELDRVPIKRRACTRATGSCDSIFFRAFEGTGRIVPDEGDVRWISPMRPSCNVGVIIAHGRLYWVPWVCDCDLQTFGAISLAPAGDFQFDAKSRPSNREVFAERVAERLVPEPGDWPTYRADSQRSARTGVVVSDNPARIWTAHLNPTAELTPPVCVEDRIFVADRDGRVRCLNARTGDVAWTAWIGGPVFYPPTIADGRAVIGGGDGYVWCFDATSGAPLWRFRTGPALRRILVYDRLQSTWPATAPVVVKDGVVYCAAGMHDFDGTHVYALDLESGEPLWENHTAGHLDAASRRGIACQGDLLLLGERLYLAGGNYISPGVFDAASGQCLNRPVPTPGSTAPRGRELQVVDNRVIVGGQPLYSVPEAPVFDASTQWPPEVVQTAEAELLTVHTDDGWALVARQGDKVAWARPLPSAPIRWSIAVDRKGRIVVALRSGTVIAFGPNEASQHD
ncbi:MAG: hypothetical protein D6741_01360 [Planctomycetota bacterium]|nr:MAG: hypothetical protein D6741_01360 [Planctomycetota bacterium]